MTPKSSENPNALLVANATYDPLLEKRHNKTRSARVFFFCEECCFVVDLAVPRIMEVGEL